MKEKRSLRGPLGFLFEQGINHGRNRKELDAIPLQLKILPLIGIKTDPMQHI